MPQGWSINAITDKVDFYEPPPVGVNNVVVEELPVSGQGGTDVFAVGAWSGRYGYPSEVEFYADRLWLAGTPLDPHVIWASCSSDYPNFGRSSPIVDSDAITVSINSRQVNAVMDLVPLDNLLVMTTGGEFKVSGGSDDVVTPFSTSVKNQGNAGSGLVQSRLMGESAIFLQEEGQKIRDLRYQFEKDGFRGNDISVWADHLFFGYEVQAIEYWKAPWQVVWFTRNDGIRLGCTYMPEQEVIGWHWHDTDGQFLDACALPGTKESECYYLVRRTVNGQVEQYIEQQAPTFYADESDLFYVDCGVTYDGRNTTPTTITLASAGGWTEENEITMTASSPLFTGDSDEGDAFMLWTDVAGVDDEGQATITRVKVRVLVTDYVSATQAVVRSVGDVPAQLQGVPVASWTFQRDSIGSLWHVEGKTVKVLQDGAVSGPYVVANGEVKLDTPGGVVHVGLGYTAEVETLELNAAGGDPMRDQYKMAHKASFLLLASRGVRVGGYKDKLYPIKERRFENYGQPPFLKTGVFDCEIPTGWGPDAGRVRIVSDDPLPMEILSITTRAVASNGQAGGART